MLGLRLDFVLNRAAPERAGCFAAFYSTMVKQAAGGTCRQDHSWCRSLSHSSLALPKMRAESPTLPLTQTVQGSDCSVRGLPVTPCYILVYQTMSVSPHVHSMVTCQCFPQHAGPHWKLETEQAGSGEGRAAVGPLWPLKHQLSFSRSISFCHVGDGLVHPCDLRSTLSPLSFR